MSYFCIMFNNQTFSVSAERITNAAPESASAKRNYKSLGLFNVKALGRVEVYHFRTFDALVVQFNTKIWVSQSSKEWSWKSLMISELCNHFEVLILNGHFKAATAKEVFGC